MEPIWDLPQPLACPLGELTMSSGAGQGGEPQVQRKTPKSQWRSNSHHVGGLMVGSMGWKPDFCVVLFWCSDSLFSSLPSPLPTYPQTRGAELHPWH